MHAGAQEGGVGAGSGAGAVLTVEGEYRVFGNWLSGGAAGFSGGVGNAAAADGAFGDVVDAVSPEQGGDRSGAYNVWAGVKRTAGAVCVGIGDAKINH